MGLRMHRQVGALRRARRPDRGLDETGVRVRSGSRRAIRATRVVAVMVPRNQGDLVPVWKVFHNSSKFFSGLRMIMAAPILAPAQEIQYNIVPAPIFAASNAFEKARRLRRALPIKWFGGLPLVSCL
jgi:hypothetical protein